MAEGSTPGEDGGAIEAALARLLRAIAEEPVPDRIATLARDLQSALDRSGSVPPGKSRR